MTDESPVRCEIDGPVATVTLNRPERRNAMTVDMVVEAHEILTELAGRGDVRIVVFTGAGDDWFCPGADLGGSSISTRTVELRHYQLPVILREMPQVTIGAINGACAGAGMGWALGCDLRVASEQARFNTAFLDVGVAGDMGLPWTLTRAVGSARARELMFLRAKFSAAEALSHGLVSSVFPAETFRAEVAAIVARLRLASPTALHFMKQHFLAAERMEFGEFVDLESERHLTIVAGDDFKEGVAAFVERRPPRFSGT
jgi:2-(1,2-epoxy-1,2-dihydrophenyl)acetyl-CoA isomerase